VIRLFIVSFIVLAALLGGCVATTVPDTRRDPWYQAVVEPVQGNDARALRFYENVLKLKGAELARELNTTRQEFDKDQSELNRVRLALLLSLPDTGYRDDQAALNLVQPFVNDKSYENSVLRPLALMLHTQLSEFKRLDETAQQQTAKAKEEQRRAEEALQQQTAKAKEEQRRAEALQQKLEAILDMEMKMIEREQTAPPPKRR